LQQKYSSITNSQNSIPVTKFYPCMNLEERIEAFVKLKTAIENLSATEKENIYQAATWQNPWFTSSNIELAMNGIAKFLSREALTKWIQSYSLPERSSKKIGVAMAGNIPMVGFHDLLCVLLSGNVLIAKLSSQDTVLMRFICEQLIKIDARFANKIFIEDRLTGLDAVIATGSDNTGRYFEYYFRNIPHIIRRNRSSCAVVMGEETEAELTELGKDVFNYFGQGCRNVSKLFVPMDFDLKKIMKSWEVYGEAANHNKYANNYHYQRSILLINLIHFYDNGSVVLTESKSLVSPTAVVYYQFYENLEHLKTLIDQNLEKIQCVVSANSWYKGSVAFGKSQSPEVWEYADGLDTLDWICTQ
jgi:hypothetical protein